MPTPDEIKQARLAAGLTKTQAASLIHSGYLVWYQYEDGLRKMSEAIWELFQIKTKSNNVKTVEDFAEELSDAYSSDRYKNGWSATIKMLRARKLNDKQIEAIIRSKWTRFAGDESNKAYGHCTSKDVERYIARVTMAQINELTEETFA